MKEERKQESLIVTEDLQHVLNVLNPEESHVLLQLKEELADNWNKKQIFRTETEMRISVLNDFNHPTNASKYWQSVRELSAHFDALMSLTFDMRRNALKRKELERKFKEAELEGDPLKIEEIQIDLDENLYAKATMSQIARDRVREIKTWSKIKSELNDGSFDDKDVNTHQAISYKYRLQNRVAALNPSSGPGEIINALGPLKTLEKLSKEEGKLISYSELNKQISEKSE